MCTIVKDSVLSRLLVLPESTILIKIDGLDSFGLDDTGSSRTFVDKRILVEFL